jgi:hypothetical protein
MIIPAVQTTPAARTHEYWALREPTLSLVAGLLS